MGSDNLSTHLLNDPVRAFNIADELLRYPNQDDNAAAYFYKLAAQAYARQANKRRKTINKLAVTIVFLCVVIIVMVVHK